MYIHTTQKDWYRRYYEGAVGLTIVAFTWKGEEDGELFPALVCKAPNGEIVVLEISQDPEGNGPGFVFGLPDPQPVKSGKDED